MTDFIPDKAAFQRLTSAVNRSNFHSYQALKLRRGAHHKHIRGITLSVQDLLEGTDLDDFNVTVIVVRDTSK